ncbi:Glucanosyltransferase-domain-containing protein [Lipomyces tetrasporus]|uniref:1,3-beta-glucanosyltransferase n=1 Tax=Lipomyces tetrasporus TaxID=54092 RepID=A0AAD7VUM5_9ASCO|nr:Glucanosyltransferase-domain-containing protein [Lipomyces tetrasporus]KAJ8102608.1 Glucanosyltransferase-domain-containing protein [Lipomyces tetrasporus]
MRFFSTATALAATAATLFYASGSAAINAIEIDGRYFVDSVTGEPFWIKGVDYQPGGSSQFASGFDPLSDANTCARDIYLFQKLGVNTVRIYSIDPTLNHDECMTLLASAGIYLFLDVNTPIYGQNLNRWEPWTTYTEAYLDHVFQVIEAFAGYNNTLAFFAGNEVVNDNTSAEASPNYVKAVVRDMKTYITNNIKRQVPVGYSAADVLEYRVPLAGYLECGPADEAVDFYGVNSYQWCGDQTFESSLYNVLVDDYTNYTIPVFLSEFGCNQVLPRTFQEVGTIFSDQFSVVFSGGLVYEYTQESTSNYGLVNLSSSDGSVQERHDYVALSSAYASVTTSGLSTVSATARPTTCATSYPYINGNTTLPDSPAATLIAEGLNSTYNRGKYIDITVRSTNYTIYAYNGDEVTDKSVSENYTIQISDASAIDQTDKSNSSATTGGSPSDSSGSPSASDGATSTGSTSSATSSSAAIANLVRSSEKMGATAVFAVILGLVFA